MSYLHLTQLVLMLNATGPAPAQVAPEPLQLDFQCELPGVTQESAEQAIRREVDEDEGRGVEAFVICGGPGEVIIHLTKEELSASSSIDLSSFAQNSRARALALALAEAIPLLVAKTDGTSATEDASSTQAAPAPAEPASPNEMELVPAASTLPPLQLRLGPTYRGYFGGDHQAGGKVSFAIYGLELGLHALAGKKDGGARGSHMGGQVGYDFFYRPYHQARPVLGLEANVGYSDSGDFSSAYGAGLCYFGWNAPLGNEWRVNFQMEGGYSIRGSDGSGEVSRFSGGFLGGSIIFAAALDRGPSSGSR